MDKVFQKKVQRILAKAGNCPFCHGLGVVNHPPGPVKIGTPMPKCDKCQGTGRLK